MRAAAPLLVMESVIVAVPFWGMVGTENALVMVGLVLKVMVADAVPPVPPLVDDTVPVVFV